MSEAKLFAGEDNLQTAQITSTDNGPFAMDKLRYSSMTKLLRVTALVCRFINRLKRGKASNGPVQASEIEQVEKLWIAYIQSKKISNDQEVIQSDPISCPQNQKGNN